MTTTPEYLAQGWTACLVGMAGHPYGPGAHDAFDARFGPSLDYENTNHPRWLADTGAAQGAMLAQQVGAIAAVLAGSAAITGANINAAADAVAAAQETPSRFC